jgi:hypothetical protein
MLDLRGKGGLGIGQRAFPDPNIRQVKIKQSA